MMWRRGRESTPSQLAMRRSPLGFLQVEDHSSQGHDGSTVTAAPVYRYRVTVDVLNH